MPWSTWHQSPDVLTSSAWGRFATYAYVDRTIDEFGNQDPNWGQTIYRVDKLSSGVDTTLTTNVVDHTYGDDDYRTHLEFLLGPNNEDPPVPLRPPALPSDFDAVTGGNWAPIPDRPFPFYVDYEEPVGSLLGWYWDGVPTVATAGASAGATLEYLGEADYFTHGPGIGTSGYNLDDHPTYQFPHGPVMGTVASGTPAGTPLPALPDPGPLFGFAYTISATTTTPYTSASITLPPVLPRVRYPRWRYWIADVPYIRLLGRGDGLGAGSNRLVGPGTPQSSVRLLGSL